MLSLRKLFRREAPQAVGRPKFYALQGWSSPQEHKTRFVFGMLYIPPHDRELSHKVDVLASQDGVSVWGGGLPDRAGDFLMGLFPIEAIEGIEYSFGKGAVESVDLSLKPELIERYGTTQVVEM